MQITLSSLLSYPNNTIRVFHLTLLTNCILAAFLPPKEELASWLEFTQSNNICRHFHQKQKCALKISLPINFLQDALFHENSGWICLYPVGTLWHNLSKRSCKCVALRTAKLGKLRWCYRNLSIRGLVTFKKIINFFIDRTIFNEP